MSSAGCTQQGRGEVVTADVDLRAIGNQHLHGCNTPALCCDMKGCPASCSA